MSPLDIRHSYLYVSMISLRSILNKILPRPAVCRNLTQWAESHGIGCIELHQPLCGELGPILGSDPRGATSFRFFIDDFSMPQSLVKLTGARIKGASGLVQLADGTHLLQGQWYMDFLRKNQHYSWLSTTKKQQISGNCYSLLSRWCDEYYHWFHDVLPRLYTSLPYLPDDTLFLMNKDPQDFQIISLNALGIDTTRLVFKSDISDVTPDLLWFSTPLGHPTGTSGEIIRIIGKAIRNYTRGSDTHGDSKTCRLWISRAKARQRKIQNEDILTPCLNEHGFEIVRMEDLHWKDQIKLCSSATHLFGPHGAGLINMIFSEAPAVIGEIGIPDMPPCYRTIAIQAGARYARLVQPVLRCDTESQILVDTNEFENWIANSIQDERNGVFRATNSN